MRTRSGTCTLNGRIVAGSGLASACACPSAIDASNSSETSRSLPHCETILSALSNPVFITLSHSSLYRTDEKKTRARHSAFHFHTVSYIGAAVPSDHTPVPIRNIYIGSGLPLYVGASKSGDPGNGSDTLLEESTRFAPHTVPSGM